MQSLSKTRGTVAAVVASSLLLLGACGGDEPDATSGDTTATPTESASEASESPASPSASPTADESEAEAGDSSGEGSWDRETLLPAMKQAMEDQETAHFTMRTDAPGASLDAEGDMELTGKQDMAMTMSGEAFGAGTMELRRVGGVIYLAMPPMTPKGKFIEMQPDDPRAGALGDMQGLDPRDTFAAFDAGLRDVTFVGEETVDGESFEHYRLTVDTRAAAKAQGMPARQQGMPPTLDYDMWLSDDALMRRVAFELQGVSMVMDMTAWGEPVDIAAPAPKDIVEAPGP